MFEITTNYTIEECNELHGQVQQYRYIASEIEAVKNGDQDVEAMREAYDQRRRFLLHELRGMGLECFEAEGAFYVFPCIKSFGMTSGEFATRLLQEERVVVVPGTAFGDCGEGFLRISYAYSIDSIKEALERIKRFVDNHSNS